MTTTTSTNHAKNLRLHNSDHIDPLFDMGDAPVDLSSFVDLDRLVLELSNCVSTGQQETGPVATQQASGFTTGQCNYLVSQFESFAKDFQRKEVFSDSSSRAR